MRTAEATIVVPAHAEEHGPSGFLKWITSTDHKIIGKSYTITSLVFFCMAGTMATVSYTHLACEIARGKLSATLIVGAEAVRSIRRERVTPAAAPPAPGATPRPAPPAGAASQAIDAIPAAFMTTFDRYLSLIHI